MPPLPITAVFAEVPDPRRETAHELHRLTDILVIATCAVLGGPESREAVAGSGRPGGAFFGRSPRLDTGTPGPDPSGRVLARPAPGAFARASGRRATACEATELAPTPADGEPARAA